MEEELLRAEQLVKMYKKLFTEISSVETKNISTFGCINHFDTLRYLKILHLDIVSLESDIKKLKSQISHIKFNKEFQQSIDNY